MGLLPEGYKRLLYIESTGTQYINTGFKPNHSTKITMGVRFTNSTAGETFAFGVRNGAGNASYLFGINPSTKKYRLDYASKQYQNNALSSDPCVKRTVTLENGVLTQSTGETLTATQGTFQCSYDLVLFAVNLTGSVSLNCSAEVDSCKIWDNGTLVRNYIPAKNPDGVAGLYDAVNGAFNSGVGTFVAGPELEYVELEYIESTGSQYVNTGFKPNNNTKVVIDYSTTATTGVIIGSDDSWLKNDFVIGVHFAAFATTSYSHKTIPSGHHIISLDKGALILDGETLTTMSGSFTGNYPLTLFATNRAGSIIEYGKLKLNSCQIYDNGSLVRDYVPVKLNDGSIGLLDKLTEEFYPNNGTGAFVAGPELPGIEPPPALEKLQAPYADFANILLVWPVVSGADGYKVTRDGELVADTQHSYLHDGGLDMQKEYAYSITAYNAAGESEPVEITVSTTEFKLITDRTAADVENVIAAINGEVVLENWISGMKGAYNAMDLNRVESAVIFVIERLRVAGIYLTANVLRWTFEDFPTVTEMQRYLNNIQLLRSALPTGLPYVPFDMNFFGYEEANSIELILERLESAVTNIMKNIYYSNEIYSGEVR